MIIDVISKLNNKMKLSNKRFCRYIVASLLLAISISCCFSNKAFAKTNTYYGDYGITGGQVCYATRVKYTYDTVNGKSVTSKKVNIKQKQVTHIVKQRNKVHIILYLALR